MPNVRKSQGKSRSALMFVSGMLFVLGGLACHKSPPTQSTGIDNGDAKTAAARIAEAESLYQGREDLNKARMAVATLRQATTADYGSYEAAWKLARVCFYVGDHTDNDSERDDAFREGTEAGKAAVALQPNKPEGHFWLAANYGGTAEHSTLASLSSFRDIQNELETVLKLDESYEGYSAYLGLARLYLQAPRVLGGDTAKGIQYLEKGVKLSPNNTMMRYDLAEAYAKNNREADAKKQIAALMSITPDPQHIPESKEAIADAQKLLKKLP